MVPLAMIVTRTLPVPSVLAAVLAGDGITLPGHGAEHAIACFNPHHRDDAAKAMRIDTVRGVYRCYGCGIRGNSWTYLTRIRGLQPQAAEALLAELGWPEELVLLSRDRHEEQERVKSGAAKYMDEPCMTVGGRNGVRRRWPEPSPSTTTGSPSRRPGMRPLQADEGHSQAYPEVSDVHTFPPGRLVGGASEAEHLGTGRGPACAGEPCRSTAFPNSWMAIEGNDREIWIVADERCVERRSATLAGHGLFQVDGKVPDHMPVRRLPGIDPENATLRRCGAEGAF